LNENQTQPPAGEKEAALMKIIVPIKRVVDSNVKIRVRVDGSGVELANLKMAINPYDEIAVEEAVRLREAGTATDVLVISVGPTEAQQVLRSALAMGADRALLIETEMALEPLAVAKLLKWAVTVEQPDLVILGRQAIDDDCNQVGQMLAALLGWQQATFASKIVMNKEEIVVAREVDDGQQTLRLDLPAVVTTDLRLNEPRYASLPSIMKAKKKPLVVTPAASLGVDTAHRLEIVRTFEPASRKAGIKVTDAAELMVRLRAELNII